MDGKENLNTESTEYTEARGALKMILVFSLVLCGKKILVCLEAPIAQ